jgi:hypothetical protein
MNEFLLTKICVGAVTLAAIMDAAGVLSMLQGASYTVAIVAGILAIKKHFKKEDK